MDASSRQLQIMEAYVRTGSQKATAFECGISIQTVKNHLTSLYARLDVSGAMGALRALGWIALPDESPVCGQLSSCGRPAGHHGLHGGMRPIVRSECE